jgi:DtxR family Mn-dependent transcriptional regulator
MSFSTSEENYLKTIYLISQKTNAMVSTSEIASDLSTAAASVTDMLKKLSEKSLVAYERYKGVRLTDSGRTHANLIVRKHRLWETFLHNILKFEWDEVHDVAEQLEHIESVTLIDRLDDFLGNPKFDPHGDPIPDKQGRFTLRAQLRLFDIPLGSKVRIIGVSDQDKALLQHLNRLNLSMNTEFLVKDRYEYDESIEISFEDGTICNLSKEVQDNLIVQHVKH